MSILESTSTDTLGEGVVWAALAAWAPDPATLAALSAMLFDEPSGSLADDGSKPRGDRNPCGSVKAYRQHLYYGERTCVKCKAAWAEYKRSKPKHARNPSAAGEVVWADCGTDQAYHRHLYWRQPTCAECRAAHSDRVCSDDKRRRQQRRAQ